MPKKINSAVTKRLCGSGSGIFKFREGDLIDRLRECHDTLDKMFVSLAEFVVGSFCAQVSLFYGKAGHGPIVNAEMV